MNIQKTGAKIIGFILVLFALNLSAQKNFIDQPYVMVSSTVDSLVSPDRIYLTITLKETDTKGNIAIEKLEKKMVEALSTLGIDTKKQLTVEDVASDYKQYLLKSKEIMKTKVYELLVYDAKMLAKVVVALENGEIANVRLKKTEYSKQKTLERTLKRLATLQAKEDAIAITEPTGQKVGNALFLSNKQNSNYYQEYNTLTDSSPALLLDYSEVDYEEPQDLNILKIMISATIQAIFKLE